MNPKEAAYSSLKYSLNHIIHGVYVVLKCAKSRLIVKKPVEGSHDIQGGKHTFLFHLVC